MKTLLSLVFSIVLTVFSFGQNKGIPHIPVGELVATPSTVQAGTFPTLSWLISHPQTIKGAAYIKPPASFEAKEETNVSVKIVRAGVSEGLVNEKDRIVDIRVSTNGSSYEQMFFGGQEDISPTHNLYIKKFNKGDTLDFGGRYIENGQWTNFYSSKSSSARVIALTNGQPFPFSTVKPELKPYVNGNGTIKVGPMSALVFMELAKTQDGDHQDAVLLINFSKAKANNGHGNNVDGVDSSNPSGGLGGPNGGEDPSGGVDDEIK